MSAATDPLQPPARLKRRQTDRAEGRIARDRLASMLVLAALLHGLVLLGVTFSAPGGSGGLQRGLEVLLVAEELPEASDNPDAAYLAQRTQEGSGNTRERLAAELPGAPPRPATEANRPSPRDPRQERLLTTSSPALSRIRIEPTPEPELLLTQQELEQLLAAEQALRLRGETREQLYVSPDTRASRAAPWLYGWIQRVERIGSEKFNTLAQRQQSGSLLLEVIIRSDGQLRRASIQRSSGNPQLDEAAREIVRLASPFDPFPPELARDFANLRFAYEWVFEGGRASGSSVRLP